MQQTVTLSYYGNRKDPSKPIPFGAKLGDVYDFDSETKTIAGVDLGPDPTNPKEWIYYLNDGTGCNIRVPIPANLDHDPRDTPVEIRFIPRPGKVNPDFLKSLTWTSDDKEVLRDVKKGLQKTGSQVVFSDGATAWAGYPEIYDRTVAEEVRFLMLKRGQNGGPAVKPTAAVRPTERENARLRALLANKMEDTVNALTSAFPELTTLELHAGMLHAQGLTWKKIEEQCEKPRSTLSKSISRFYEVTGWSRNNRRMGMGKKLTLDESRDGQPP